MHVTVSLMKSLHKIIKLDLSKNVFMSLTGASIQYVTSKVELLVTLFLSLSSAITVNITKDQIPRDYQ